MRYRTEPAAQSIRIISMHILSQFLRDFWCTYGAYADSSHPPVCRLGFKRHATGQSQATDNFPFSGVVPSTPFFLSLRPAGHPCKENFAEPTFPRVRPVSLHRNAPAFECQCDQPSAIRFPRRPPLSLRTRCGAATDPLITVTQDKRQSLIP